MSGSRKDGKPLRVLLLTPDYPPAVGGIQSLLFNTMTAMPDVEVRVVTPSQGDTKSFDSSTGQTIRRTYSPFAKASTKSAFFNLTALGKVGAWQPDVVLNGHIVTSPAAAALARRFKVPNVLYTYGKELAGRPKLAAWALSHSDAAIAISNFTRSQLLRAVGGASSTPIHIVNPGVAEPPTKPSRVDNTPTITTIARLRDWYKGHDMLLAAMPAVLERVPSARWIVAGEGKLRPELEARAVSLGLDASVSFLGAISEETKGKLLANSDVFAMPSRYPRGETGGEGFGIVYLEAAVWGVPSVASRFGATAEAVIDGETGLLVDPESPDEIAEALIRLLEDRSSAASLGEAARQRALEYFRWPIVAGQLKRVLAGIRSSD